MPPKSHPSDWDRLFDPHGPRRRGPIGLFVFVSLLLVICGVAFFGANIGVKRYDVYAAGQALTATPLWAKYYEGQTATALAKAAKAATPTPQPEQTTTVVNGGNLRSEPRIAPNTVVGQLTTGDVVAILENRTANNQLWYRVRITQAKGATAAGTTGWASATLLAPLPTPTAKP